MVFKNSKLWKVIVFAFAGITFPTISSRAFDNYKWIDPPQLFEISSYPDSGFFRSIHDIAVNQKENAIFVLHDTPAILSKFSAVDGTSLSQVKIIDRVEAPARLVVFQNNVYIIFKRKLWAVSPEGRIIAPDFLAGKPDTPVDLAASYYDFLWVADTKSKTITRLNKKAEVELLIGGSKEKNKEGISYGDLATCFPDKLFVLDAKNSVVRQYGKTGGQSSEIKLFNFFDSPSQPQILSIALDGSFNLWAVNKTENTIDGYDKFGNLSYKIKDSQDLGFRLLNPTKIAAYDPDRLVFIDDGDVSVKVLDIRTFR